MNPQDSFLALTTGLAFAAVAALAGCGGGGGSDSSDGPSVSAVVVGSAPLRYGQPVLLTLTGTRLDTGITASSALCRNASLVTSQPTVSTATTAYLQCTISGIGTGQIAVVRSSDGATLATVTLTVPVPQVTVSVANGAGVAGTFVVTLAPDKTPLTVDNFLSYVRQGYYAQTIFHRVAPGFVVQAGGYLAPIGAALPAAKPASAPVALEVGKGLSNVQFTIAMARTLNSANSATSQFFINLADNSAALDPGPLTGAGFAVFGSVTLGVSAVNAIATAPCVIPAPLPDFLGPGDCLPTPAMVITSAVQTQ